MTVLDQIKNITDRGLFEKICVDILRNIRPEYANIIHGGLNEKGEPVPSPLDAFHCDQNGNFVLIEVTSDDSNLRRKWLDKNTGDVFKALGKVQEWHSNFPEAAFTLWLCTNQRVKDSHHNKLFTDVVELCKQSGVTVEFLEQSAIVSYLEDTPIGQWIAQKSLHISAKQLSKPKLLDLTLVNLEAYAREIFAGELITRACEVDLAEILDQSYSPVLLVAKSGMGKSTIAYNILKNCSKTKKWGLRINHSIAADSSSLTQAISKQLLQHQNDLFISPSQFQNLSEKVLIVIDDINKATNPTILLEHILLWQRESSFNVLIPVWQNVYDQLPKRFKEENTDEKNKPELSETVLLLGYSTEESIAALKLSSLNSAQKFSDQQFERISEELFNDPFLIRIYGDLTGIDQDNWLAKTSAPIEEYIGERLLDIQQKASIPHFSLEQALLKLADHMLKSKLQFISFVALEDKLDREDIKILHQIGLNNAIFSIGPEGQLIFKHDKLRDYLLSKAIARMFSDLPKHIQTLSEPYYAELIGRALSNTNGEQRSNISKWLLGHLPLAVVESLNYHQDEDAHGLITQQLITWLKTHKEKLNEATLISIKASLNNIHNPSVIQICDCLDTDFYTLGANFLNGHTGDGIRYIARFANSDFEPNSGNARRDYLMANFNNRFKENGIADLKKYLSVPTYTIQQKNAIIMFAGYLRSQELFDPIFERWQSDKKALFMNSIWALIISFQAGKEEKLQEVFDFWASLPESKKTNGFPEGTKALSTYNLGRYKEFAVNEALAAFLLKNTQREDYLNLFFAVTAYMDHPDLIEFTIRHFAKIKRQLSQQEGLYVASLTISKFPERWSPRHQSGKSLSTASRNRLLSLWNNQPDDQFLTLQAFVLWSVGADESEGHILQKIDLDNPELYSRTITTRMLIGDHSVLADLKQIIKAENRQNGKYIEHLCLIWDQATKEYVDSLLNLYHPNQDQKFKHSNSWVLSSIAELLFYCPDADVSYLLEKHWDRLGYLSEFVILALLTGTKKTADLAAQVFPQYPDPKALFKYLDIKFTSGKIVDLIQFKRKPLTTQVLENLKPHLAYFSQSVLETLMMNASTATERAFIKTNVLPILKKKPGHFDHVKDLFPSEEDISDEFDEFVRVPKSRWRIDSWLERLEKNGISRKEIISTLLKTIKKTPVSQPQLDCFSRVMENIGDRSDLMFIEELDPKNQNKTLWTDLEYHIKRKLLN
ncbi:hypothetical protein OC25_03655 [Pedobacter kyungheensis]|uniref:Uncharacterized protein n=1 Tax=Pedobacter kyungheensis TaxID=1069985 RepID=A0A0C1G7U5_9SPHI|nr:hypothetical protein [Pedobacter kyungheensis]KIA96189.1 hypothetical protein OC25_03655 [Pedobacter kyungheensis]